jgi:hypothetical protein
MAMSKAAVTGAIRGRALRVVAMIGVAAVLAGCQSTSASPSGATSSPASVEPTSVATTIAPYTAGGPPVDADGWPVVIKTDVLEKVVVGPDGTVYSSALVPVDGTGHGRVGWLRLDDGTYVVPSAFASDGSAFGESGGNLWAFGPDGKPRSGWPIDVAASSWALSPGGKVYLMQWPTEGSTQVTILDDNAAPVSSWSVPKVLDYSCDYLIQQDGTFWLTYPVTDPSWWGACEVHAFDTNGKEVSAGGAADLRWSGMATSSSGVIVAWYYQFNEESQARPEKTRVAVLGLDGKPAAGWPVTLDGAASPPAFGADGSVYFTLLAGPSDQIVAFDQAGHVKPGWPVALSGDLLTVAAPDVEPLRPQPPIVGEGLVYVASQGRIDAFDSAGKSPAGWPYTLPAAWNDSRCAGVSGQKPWNSGPIYSAGSSGSGRLYLGLENGIVALSADGSVAAGWPYPAGADFVCWRQLDAAPAGGLVVTSYYAPADGPEYRIVRLTPEGAPSQ